MSDKQPQAISAELQRMLDTMPDLRLRDSLALMASQSAQYLRERDALRVKLRRYQEAMRWIGEGMHDIHWPTDNGTRDWISDLQIYLRGDAAVLLTMEPHQMRCLLATITEAKNEA